MGPRHRQLWPGRRTGAAVIINQDPDFTALQQFVADRIKESESLPTLITAARQIRTMAVDYQDEYAPDYAGGYADAAEDALRAISGVWRYHPDYQGWADDE